MLAELVPGEVAGCAIVLDTLRYVRGENGAGNHIYLLGFSAQTSVAKAVWANLIPPHFNYLDVNDQLYVLADGGKGWELRTSRVSTGIDHLVLFPPCADRWAGMGEMLIVDRAGTTAATTLMRLLEYRSSVPLDGVWADDVWDWANEIGAALALDGFGPHAWLVRLSDEALLKALTRFARATAAASDDSTNR
ncbi:MAG: hypothetical protein ACR2PL_17015 [Dehalococcoidia bacterium]